MKQIRLHAKIERVLVQPKSLDRPKLDTESIALGSFTRYVIDADGNPIYEE